MNRPLGLLALLATVACSTSANDKTSRDTTSQTASTSTANVAGGTPGIVEVVGRDYAFSIPDSLPSGRTSFKFVNKGKVRHEFNIVLLKKEVTLPQFIAAANAKEKLTPLMDGGVGVLFAGPGQQSGAMLSTHLLPGRTYAVQCIFKDSAAVQSHREMGMFKSISVKAGDAPAVAAVKTDTIFGMDYAYRAPATLAPGLHRLVFVNNGKQRHELAIELLKPGVTMQQVLKVGAEDGDLDALFEQSMGLLHAMGGITPLGTLDFEVLPGREYMFICEFSDTPKSPPHVQLGMFGSIRGASQ